jgi:hypothetical protein
VTRRNAARSRNLSGSELTARRTLQRLRSVPTWFLRHNSSEDKSPTSVFQFPESANNTVEQDGNKPIADKKSNSTEQIIMSSKKNDATSDANDEPLVFDENLISEPKKI